MKVISIGDLVTDFYYKDNKLVGVSGGMSSHNIIANIAKMGMETAVYGVCGNDNAGNIALKSLSDLGVDVENTLVIDEISTRCFHVSYTYDSDKLTFTSKKRCPYCNEKKWYNESKIQEDKILKLIDPSDILVFDNLNIKNQIIIDGCNNRKMLDLGQYYELENYSNEEIIEKIYNKFDIINLNERVEKYLLDRFSLDSASLLYDMFSLKMLIVTRGIKGTEFIFDNKCITKTLASPTKEVDPTGAGDAFFSVVILNYIKNDFCIDDEFIDSVFDCAIKLTSQVVKNFGARGHLQKLYKIKKIKDSCSCNKFDIVIRKPIKRCNINVNNLEKRIINAISSSAYSKLSQIPFEDFNNSVFIGTGGSFAAASFSARVINELYGLNTLTLLPRDFYYRNNKLVDSLFLFSYSGTTNDLITASEKIDNKYIITKGETSKITLKTNISKEKIISYRTSFNKGKERGFLSFEGVLAPASLFLKLYFIENKKENIEGFIKESIIYWKNYFDRYFMNNKSMLKEFFSTSSSFNIFVGDYTTACGNDLESKIIESGIFNCLIHEKKNFSHGRFVNYELLSQKKNIYLKQKSTSVYEKELLNYLKNDNIIIIESRYDGILCEYDLLIASQYFIYYTAKILDVDISKPSYSEEAMNIYFYKGKL